MNYLKLQPEQIENLNSELKNITKKLSKSQKIKGIYIMPLKTEEKNPRITIVVIIASHLGLISDKINKLRNELNNYYASKEAKEKLGLQINLDLDDYDNYIIDEKNNISKINEYYLSKSIILLDKEQNLTTLQNYSKSDLNIKKRKSEFPSILNFTKKEKVLLRK